MTPRARAGVQPDQARRRQDRAASSTPAGLAAGAIHGNKCQAQRERALAAFKSGEMPVLVATDIAARGIDIPGVSHVVNFDLPDVPEQYVHRIGRTARAGADGIAIAFCSARRARQPARYRAHHAPAHRGCAAAGRFHGQAEAFKRLKPCSRRPPPSSPPATTTAATAQRRDRRSRKASVRHSAPALIRFIVRMGARAAVSVPWPGSGRRRRRPRMADSSTAPWSPTTRSIRAIPVSMHAASQDKLQRTGGVTFARHSLRSLLRV